MNKEFNNFNFAATILLFFDLIEISPIDIVIIDNNLTDINLCLVIKKNKIKIENVQILLLTDETGITEDISKTNQRNHFEKLFR